MALTSFRWAALCVIGFFVAAALLLQERRPPWDWWQRDDVTLQRQRLGQRRDLTRSHVTEAAERWYLVQVLDSVKRLRGARRVSSPMIDPAFTPRVRAHIDTMIARASANHHGTAITDLIVVSDTAETFRGAPRQRYHGLVTVDYVLPAPGSAERCVALVRVKETGERRVLWPTLKSTLGSDITSGRLWGPCAFYEAFGSPGSGTGAWLTRQGWKFALLDPNDTTPAQWNPPRWGAYEWQQAPSTEFLSTNAAACAAGRRARCTPAFVGGARSSWEARVWNSNIVSTWTFNPYIVSNRYWWWDAPDLGPLQWTLLSDMARSVGPERFRAFWQSDREPVEAFRTATGQELDAWLESWLRRTYGPQLAGPTLSAGGGTTGLLATALGILIAIAVARRRSTD